MNYWLDCLNKYAEFSGRARRAEYWMFTAFNILFGIGFQIVDVLLGTGGILGGLFSLALLLPGLAVFVCRMHDTGRSGWWWLIVFVPIVGVIVAIVFLCQDSQPGENAYGPNPKGL